MTSRPEDGASHQGGAPDGRRTGDARMDEPRGDPAPDAGEAARAEDPPAPPAGPDAVSQEAEAARAALRAAEEGVEDLARAASGLARVAAEAAGAPRAADAAEDEAENEAQDAGPDAAAPDPAPAASRAAQRPDRRRGGRVDRVRRGAAALRRELTRRARHRIRAAREALRREGPSRLQFWVIALLLGIASGYAAILFRLAIAEIQTFIYGADDHRLHSTLEGLGTAVVIGVPILGGLAVGLILHWFTPDGKAQSVSHVIEAAALKGGRLDKGSGRASALASLITLSTGGSTGREGPVVHLAALISSWISARIDASAMTGRDLLGCAVAAAVSASFNAPIAGALFAMEVVLRHFALHAFAPIVIASIAGAVVSRLNMGNVTEFMLREQNLAFYQELPAFLILGLVCGLVAAALMRGIFFAEGLGDRIHRATGMPGWLRPGVSGAILGVIAVWFPHIIGVGYETTTLALTAHLGFWTAVGFAAVKAVAVAITFAGRMGGGIFSPSLMMGAFTGLAFGYVAKDIFPSVSGSEALYALAGMGAVAAAVLGAPVSTSMIIFELTGDWQAGIAVMASVSTATVVASSLVHKSFFLTQLELRGIHLAEGAHAWIPGTIPVRDVMRLRGSDAGAPDGTCWQLAEQGASLARGDSLEKALPLFDRMKAPFLPVVDETPDGGRELIGALFHVDALKAYNRALVATYQEEHS